MTSYARAIERAWCALWEQPVILSPRDWETITRWHARGVPLEIVREAMEAWAERRKRRGGATAVALSRLESAVDEAWAVVLDGRLSPEPDVPAPAEDPREAWMRRIHAEPEGSVLSARLRELLQLFDAGAQPAEVDAALDRDLEQWLPEGMSGRVASEVAEELEPYRGRIPAAQLEATLQRATIERLRRQLDLPRLERAPD